MKVPVIAAGGIADAKGVAAAMALGAAGVQLGTAYLLAPKRARARCIALLGKPGRVPYRRHQRFQRPACARHPEPGDTGA